jgi:hypothetical protein
MGRAHDKIPHLMNDDLVTVREAAEDCCFTLTIISIATTPY